jgi:hypothetical protein
MTERFFQGLVFLLLTMISAIAVSAQVLPDTKKIAAPTSASGTITRRYRELSLDVPHNVEINLDNRSTGRITIVGWDRDLISAHAFSQRGDEVVKIGQYSDGAEMKISLKADYADLDSPDPAYRVLDQPPVGDDGPLQIHLEVSVPRQAVIQSIRVFRSNVQISNMDTPLSIVGDQSLVTLKQIGSAEVHTRSGNVEIEDTKGLIEVTTTSGAIHITNAKAGLRAVTIAGPIEIKCAHGRVDVSNTNAPIDLYNVGGDVDAIGASSSVSFFGPLQDGARYYLKSMSGKVEMNLPANTSGFNATLSSYRGIVESEFQLKSIKLKEKEIVRDGEKEIKRRISGQFGRGGPQIMLDSFEGLVRLSRLAKLPASTCR